MFLLESRENRCVMCSPEDGISKNLLIVEFPVTIGTLSFCCLLRRVIVHFSHLPNACMERMIIVTIKWLFNNYTNPTSTGREFWLKKNEEQIQKMAKWNWKSMWNNIAKRIAQVSDLTVFTVKRFWVKITSGASKVHTYFLIFLSSLSPARKKFINDVT